MDRATEPPPDPPMDRAVDPATAEDGTGSDRGSNEIRSWRSLFADLAQGGPQVLRGETATGHDLVTEWLDQLNRYGWEIWRDLRIPQHGRGVAQGLEQGQAIDHLAVGPGGVFAVNAKHLSSPVRVTRNAIFVAEAKTDYVKSARRTASAVSGYLAELGVRRVDVQPILLFVGAEVDRKQQPKGALVMRGREIIEYLRTEDSRLTPAAQAQVNDAVRRWAAHG